MVTVILVVFFSAGTVAIGAEDKMQAPVNYPHVGLSITLPQGFTTHIVADSTVVMRAGMLIAGQPARAVTVSAFCVSPKTTAVEFADFSDKALKAKLSVRKFQSLKSVPIKVAGIVGVARLQKYTYDGAKTTAAKVSFIRQLKDEGLSICYMLNVEVGAKHESALLPSLDKVIKGLKLTKVQSPAAIPTRLSDGKLTDYRGGFSVRIPHGWYGAAVRGGVSMGQRNYLIGGVDSPQVAILSSPAKPDASSETFAKMAVSRYLAATTQPDSGVELLSQSSVKIGQQDAYQYVLKMTYAVAPTTQPSSGEAKAVKVARIQAVRVVCRLDEDGKAVRAYLFTLSCQESEAKLVSTWLDTLGQGMEYLPFTDTTSKPKKAASEPQAPRS